MSVPDLVIYVQVIERPHGVRRGRLLRRLGRWLYRAFRRNG